MKDLFIRSVLGDEESLTDYSVTRRNSVNGEKQIQVFVTKTDMNEHSYPLVQNEAYFIYESDEYIIKFHNERTKGNRVYAECKAIHRMFDDLSNKWIYDTITGTKSIRQIIDFVTDGTGYTVFIDETDIPTSVEVENFGDDNALSLLKDTLSKFGVEFDVIGDTIYIAKEIARYTDEKIIYQYNISNPSKEIDTSSLKTYIRGFGKQNEDGTYVVEAEYTSPLADIYNIKHAEPIRDERYTNYDSLLEAMRRKLFDSIDISIKLTYVQLKEMGIIDIQKGDYIWCIIEPFDIDVRIRVIEIEDYSDDLKSPVFTLGSMTKKATDIMSSFNSTAKTVNNVVNTETGKIKDSALGTNANYVVKAVESTFSEIDYNKYGISLTDVANFMRFVRLKKGGIFVCTDGTFMKLAVSPDGLNLDVAYGRLSDDKVSVGSNTVFEQGYDPSQKANDVIATSSSKGLMSSQDKQKLDNIQLDEQGNVVVEVPLVSTTEDGLMSSIDKQKLDKFLIVDLEQINFDDIVQQIQELEQRVTALESSGGA